MNEIVIVKRNNDPDDGMFSADTGTVNGFDKRTIAVFGEQRRVSNYIKSFLRKTGKSIRDYTSTEEVIIEFLDYLENINFEA